MAAGRPAPPAPGDDPGDKLSRTWDEVRRIVAEFHALLPRDLAGAIGAAYARYSTRYQDSIADQLRTILADALRKGVFIPLEHVFFDLGVRGCKSDRPGLNALRACLTRKAATVVFFFATNRLFRKTYRSLQFVEEVVVEKGARAVFVKSGVDTADGRRWRGLLNMHAMMDEFVVGTTADHVRAAHEGLLEKRLVFGTISFGYAGRPLDGQLTRRGRARAALEPDPVAGGWVRRVFHWYVVDLLSTDEIVRRLNADPTAPPPPKSRNGVWTRGAVRRLLSNARYRGCWRYGVTETVWVSSKDYARQVARREPLREVQIEELRLVPDDQWFAAQVRLGKAAARAAGRKPRDGDATARPRILNGLFRCPAHDRPLYVAGVRGRYMACKDCRGLPAADRPLFSQLPRALALRKTCEALARLVAADAGLVEMVVAACRAEAARLQTPDPDALKALAARRDQYDRRIGFVLRNPGDTDADQEVSAAELKRLRRERAAAQAELDAAGSAAGRPVAVPTADEVRRMVAGMADVLAAAAGGGSEETAGLVRELIDRLTGGRIDLEQAGERRPGRGWLRGRFRVSPVGAVAAGLAGRAVPGPEETVVEVEYRDDEPGVDPAVAGEVRRLYGEKVLIKEIARRVGLNRNAVTGILGAWFAEQGLEPPDGRTRRAGLPRKHLEAPGYQQVADRVKGLADAGRLFGEIAAELGLDRNTVTAAWRHWHASRNLPVPDGRTRRKELPRKSDPPAPDGPSA